MCEVRVNFPFRLCFFASQIFFFVAFFRVSGVMCRVGLSRLRPAPSPFTLLHRPALDANPGDSGKRVTDAYTTRRAERIVPPMPSMENYKMRDAIKAGGHAHMRKVCPNLASKSCANFV